MAVPRARGAGRGAAQPRAGRVRPAAEPGRAFPL